LVDDRHLQYREHDRAGAPGDGDPGQGPVPGLVLIGRLIGRAPPGRERFALICQRLAQTRPRRQQRELWRVVQIEVSATRVLLVGGDCLEFALQVRLPVGERGGRGPAASAGEWFRIGRIHG
jgi:hypothetical protein